MRTTFGPRVTKCRNPLQRISARNPLTPSGCHNGPDQPRSPPAGWRVSPPVRTLRMPSRGFFGLNLYCAIVWIRFTFDRNRPRRPPCVEFTAISIHRAALLMMQSVYWKSLCFFPPPDSLLTTAEIGSDFFPGVQSAGRFTHRRLKLSAEGLAGYAHVCSRPAGYAWQPIHYIQAKAVKGGQCASVRLCPLPQGWPINITTFRRNGQHPGECIALVRESREF